MVRNMNIQELIKLALPDAVSSLESASAADVQNEKEFTFYALLSDMKDLSIADKSERHEQWSICIDKKGHKARIRGIDDSEFELTTKSKISSIESLETTCEIPKEMFQSLKKMGKDGYFKQRYYFNINSVSELTWEVDVFHLNGGEQDCWVKIDLEIDDVTKEIPKFPVRCERVIWADDPNVTEADQRLIDQLWDERWQKIDTDPVIITEDTEKYDIEIEIGGV